MRVLLAVLFACGPALADTAPPSPSPPAGGPAAVHHSRHHHRTRHVAIAPLPRQPALPGSREAAFEPAPVPNPDATRPNIGGEPETTATPAILSRHVPEVGEGYVYGSSPQALDDRNTTKAPGVDVTVPVK